MIGNLEKRKKRLRGIMGFGDSSEEQMVEMDQGEDDFLSIDDEESEVDPKSEEMKRKARLFALLAPKFAKK